MTMKEYTVRELLEEKGTQCQLEILSGPETLNQVLTTSEISRPGMALTGFTDNFLYKRVQILGQTEISYLKKQDSKHLLMAIQRIMEFPIPCIIVTKGLPVPRELLKCAAPKQTAILRTSHDTTPFIHDLTAILEEVFAPRMTMHATLVDVYGVGLLFTGKSGVGKSECALDLVDRGHRLVADDVVLIRRQSRDVLIGSASELLRHYIEIRGIGIIDVRSMFGVRSIRINKRIEVEVSLELWQEDTKYERLGLGKNTTVLLGVEIPKVVIPLTPGKNITALAEVIAMNHMLKMYGINPAEEFNDNLKKLLQKQTLLSEYLREDSE
jgi:HPr kinase/phosphorylase